jgi:DNA-binding GntR family transcriptional regulator
MTVRLIMQGEADMHEQDNGSMDQSSFTPVQYPSPVTLIADQLRSAIMRGELAPGQQLRETNLARRFGVSRNPLREAMQRLLQEGILENFRNRGMFVVTLGVQDVVDVYRARNVIERTASLLILDRDPDRAADRLTEAHAAMKDAVRLGDQGARRDADQRFHEILLEEAGSRRLERMFATIFVESRLCMNALETRYHEPGAAVHEHLDIAEAIRNRDREAIANTIDTHMRTGIELLTTNIWDSEDPTTTRKSPA